MAVTEENFREREPQAESRRTGRQQGGMGRQQGGMGQPAPTVESQQVSNEQAGQAQRRRGAQRRGLSGELLEEYLRLGQVARGEGPDSKAVEDIRSMGQSLRAQARGAGARSRDPFAAARNITAQRASGEILAAQEREAAAQRLAEQEQARQIMKQMEIGAEIRQEQARLAEAQREDFLAQGIGGLLGGGLGALGVYLSGGAALPIYQAAITGGGTAGSQLARFVSDERMKSNVRDGNKEIQEMLDAIAPKTYNKAGKKETGVMAQDLEKSSAGSEMVEEIEGVKTVGPDFNKVLAALGQLNNRLSKLEGKKK